MIERVCRQCGESYRTFPSQRPTYCSARCAGLAKKTGSEVACRQCGKAVYQFAHRPRLYCSRSCKTTASNLTSANPSFSRDISGANNPMHGKGFFGPANPMYGRRKEAAPNWRGGRKVRGDGYVLVAAPDDHPHPAHASSSGTKYVLEHRLVVERRLGRYLLPGEVVHHIDGDPSNNADANLRLYGSQRDHVTLAHGPAPSGST